jgi:AbrB family looped-hinge helix DNA binding protein
MARHALPLGPAVPHPVLTFVLRTEISMETTTLSSKGQVIIPRRIRATRGWKPGVRFAVEEGGEAIVLRPPSPFPETRIEGVLGCTGYRGPARSLGDMVEAIARGARELRK